MSDPMAAGICSRCGENGYDCRCEQFHPNKEVPGMSALINDPFLAKVWNDIKAELDRATVKHPHYPADHMRRTLIMLEEAGEVAKATLELTRPGTQFRLTFTQELYLELVHTAAMCVRQLQAMCVEEETRK